jgi:dihydrofolate reductase
MNMGKVGAGFSMSLDGFIAGPNDDVQRLFGWMMMGDTELKLSQGDRDFDLEVSEQSAQIFEETIQSIGAIVSGRRMFDVAGAWGGKHPLNVPIVVLTHRVPQEWVKEGSPFTFVTDGIESAIAKAQRSPGIKAWASAARMLHGSVSRPDCSTRSRSTSCPSCWAGASASLSTWVSSLSNWRSAA